MADSAMVSAYFFAQKIEDFHPRFSWGVFKHPLFSGSHVQNRCRYFSVCSMILCFIITPLSLLPTIISTANLAISETE